MGDDMAALTSATQFNPDPVNVHHRRIRNIGVWIWPALIAFIVIGWGWLGFRVVACWGNVGAISDWMCHYSFTAPMVVGVLVIAGLPLSVFVLMCLGRDIERGEQSEAPVMNRSALAMHHARRGYRNLEATHQKHVRRVFLFAMAAMGGFIGFLVFYFQLPALAAIIAGAVPFIAALIINQIWLTPSD